MTVRDFMTRRVVTVAPDAPALVAAKLMLEHTISGLPVVDAEQHVVGIVSEHDLLRQPDGGKRKPHWLQLMVEERGLAGETAGFRDRKVDDVMTPNPMMITASSSLEEACRLIADYGIKRLPVVENGKLVGIIARADLVRALAQARQKVRVTTIPDVSVEERQRQLEREIWRTRMRVTKPF
jgi:CBS domain-containing protein